METSATFHSDVDDNKYNFKEPAVASGRRLSVCEEPSPKESNSSINESLIYYSRVGDAHEVEEFLKIKHTGSSQLNVNHLGDVKWNRGSSALHIACYFGHLNVVELLLADSDIDINIKNNHCETPLHKAALTGRTEIVRRLLACSANVFLKDGRGRKASEIAESSEIRNLIKDMETIQKSDQIDKFLKACREGNLVAIRSLLSGPNPPDVHHGDVDGNLALHHAARSDQKEAASVLLQYGADPYRKNAHGKTSFDFVVSDAMQRILEIKPPIKFVPKCQPFEGILLKCNRVWNIWRKNWVYLNRGTISFYKSKKDVGNEHSRKAYRHLDGAEVHLSRKGGDFSVRFSQGGTFYLRIPSNTDTKYRDSWIAAIKEHIAYSNHYVGLSETQNPQTATLKTIETAFGEAKSKLDDFLEAVANFSENLSHQTTRRDSHGTTSILNIAGAGAHAYGALQQCLDMLREQDQLREQQLVEERERCRVLENALQVLASEHEAVLNSVEQLTSSGSLSSANSVYFSPAESVADMLERPEDDYQSMLSADEDAHDASFDDQTSITTAQSDSTGAADDNPAAVDYFTMGNDSIDRDGEQMLAPRSKFGGRTTLPVPQFSRTDFSIWSVLKQCIGKDLSKITMPVVFNEPLSFLQRMSEYMEYAHLLDQAALSEDPVERVLYVAAFAISSCASNADRIGKPFNPLLGETFELSRPELGYRMVCEQVSHHPPVSAFDASADTWHFFGSILPKLRFWGKSVEIQPKGTVTVELKKYKESYTWSNVNLHVNNIIVGKLWIEQYGTMEIVNHSSGPSVVLNFHPTGWMNKELHKVNGFVVDKSKTQLKAIFGKWTEFLRYVDVDSFERISRSGSNRKRLSIDRPHSRSQSVSNERENGNGSRLVGAGDHDLPDRASDMTLTDNGSVLNGEQDIPGSKLLWQIDPRPSYCSKYYGFSVFAMGLNELDENMKGMLAPTDCRYRPDIRMLENGDLDGASQEKNRLEEKQRAARTRKNNKRSKDEWTPTWFQLRKNPATGVEDWMFTDKYWDRDYSDCPDIY